MTIKHVVSVSGGKDSLATLLIAIARFGLHRVIAIFCDTGNEHELTHQYLDYLERALGLKIHRLNASFSEEIAGKRAFIARDARTRREYSRVPLLDKSGAPVLRKTSQGDIELRMVWKRDGSFDLEGIPRTRKAGGRKVRWSNKAKRRALEVLHPTGNPFLDLCLWKGRFPSRRAQFCTEELKRNIAVAFQLDLMEQGHTVVSWQGVRRDESEARKNALKFERVGGGLYIYRPIVEWTAAQVFAFARERLVKPNPLYLQGMGRVGCMPCINCGKDELREISQRFIEHLNRVFSWEDLVGRCSKRGFSTFFADSHSAQDRRIVYRDLHVWARVEWSKTTRGGKQYDLFSMPAEPTACSSAYGLCE